MPINIDDLTLAQIRELRQMSEANSNTNDLPFPVGTEVYFRTLAYHGCGRIAGLSGRWLILENAAYVGSDGRYSEATSVGLQNVSKSEIEMVGGDGQMRVNLNIVCDVVRHPCGLPSQTK